MNETLDSILDDLRSIQASQLILSQRIQAFAKTRLVFVNPPGVQFRLNDTEDMLGDSSGAMVRRLGSCAISLDIDMDRNLIIDPEYWKTLCTKALVELQTEVVRSCRQLSGDRQGRHLHNISGTTPELSCMFDNRKLLVYVTMIIRLEQTVYNCGVVGDPADAK